MVDQRRGTRPQKDQAVNCPRCNSTNTKFCYYNNYSLTQPRYFCKTCRRYWTEGGSLRNVPVGGGSRKNKRSSSSSQSQSQASQATPSNPTLSSSLSPPPPSSSSNKKLMLNDQIISHHHNQPPLLSFPLNLHHQQQSASQNPKLIHQGQDLNLAYPPTHHDLNMSRIPFLHDSNQPQHHYINTSIGVNPSSASANTTTSSATTTNTTNVSTSSSQQVSAMELLKTGISSRGLMSSFMSMPVAPQDPHHHHHHQQFSSFANLGHHEFKPSLSFGLDQFHHHHQGGGNYATNGSNGVHQETSARLLFPTEDLKQVSSNTTNTTATTDQEQDHDHDGHQFEQINRGQGDNSSTGGYNWNGMLGGGSW